MNKSEVEGIVTRLAALYTGAVADVMDEMGHRCQAFPQGLRSLEPGTTLAGVAFTVRGRPLTAEPDDDPRYRQIQMLEAITPHSVVVLDPGNEVTAAHWGELMSATASAAGARGAIVNGGIRDIRQIRDMSFPTFGLYASPLTAVWRWELTDFQQPILLDGLVVTPGDLVLADDDGALCIPRAIAVDVLTRAEDVVAKEHLVYDGLRAGRGIRELFEAHGAF